MRRAHVLLAILLSALCAGTAQAQVRSVEVRTPRPFGYFLGDLVRGQIDIVVDEGFTLQAASLPQPGALTYWLDLRGVTVEDTKDGDARRVRLNLTYQTFYAALDTRPLEIPGFALTFVSEADRGATTATAQVPAWSFTVSPLREVQPPAQADPADYMRPDGRAPLLDPQPMLTAAAWFAGLAALALGLLARDRAWWPFRARRARAFAAVRRSLRALAGRPDKDAAYGEALLGLHRGIDETAGRRVLADDLPDFLARHAAYRGQGADLEKFFSASRLAFFGRELSAARETLPLAELEKTARRLAASERGA